MRISRTLSLVSLSLFAATFWYGIQPAAAHAAVPTDLHATLESAITAVKPALVRIHVVAVEYAEGRAVKQEEYGSGVIINKSGYVITNHHVAGRAKYFTCTLANKEEIPADLVGSDPLSDIAVIKLRPAQERSFPFVRFGDSSAVHVGDRVFALGSPLAFSQSVTMGIVSNTELTLPAMFGSNAFTVDGEPVGSLVRWIAHDAQIFPGNSGGPLVNARGEIIGINEISVGLGGAIPGNLAHSVSLQLIAFHKVRRSWIGLEAQPPLKSERQIHGILVAGVLSGSPAEKAGFKSGDLLISLAGKPVDIRFQEEMPLFNQQVMALPIGKPTTAVVLRHGKPVTLQLTTQERPGANPAEAEFKSWGMSAANLSQMTAKELKRASVEGVIVTGLRPGGPADSAKPSLNDRDIIIAIAGHPVNNINDLRRISDQLTAGKTDPTPTLVAFERRTERYLTVVKLGIQEPHDPGREVRKAWLPIATQVLTADLAENLGLKDRTGVRITQVYPHTSADKAGLKVGDILVAVDDVPIQASQPEDTDVLPALIRQYPIDSTAEFTIIRDSKEMKAKVVLTASPKLEREMKTYSDDEYDFIGRDITFSDRIRHSWPESQTGVLVTSVSSGGWAALGHLQTDDLIRSVDGVSIDKVDSLSAVMARVAKRKPSTIIVQVQRGITTAYLQIDASWDGSKAK